MVIGGDANSADGVRPRLASIPPAGIVSTIDGDRRSHPPATSRTRRRSCAAWRGSRARSAGCRRMVADEAYCVDVLTQVAAVTKALEGVSLKLLADHTNHCVRDAVERGGADADEKVDELLTAVERFARTR